jgi:hypothetical protein
MLFNIYSSRLFGWYNRLYRADITFILFIQWLKMDYSHTSACFEEPLSVNRIPFGVITMNITITQLFVLEIFITIRIVSWLINQMQVLSSPIELYNIHCVLYIVNGMFFYSAGIS